MAAYHVHRQQKHRVPKRLFMMLFVVVLLLVGGVIAVRRVYDQDLRAVSSDQKTQIVTVESGTTSTQIAKTLANKHLIRSAWAFELYVHSNQLSNKLQAGTYALSPSQSIPTIIATLTKGKVSTGLVTILPGRRLDQLRDDLINSGFEPAAVDKALEPAQYTDVPTLAYKPAGANLEGLLYPDSFERTADTDPSVIVRESLAELGQYLTSDVQAAFAKEGLTTYQGITLASIVEKEVSNQSDRAQAAQVFLKRMQTGMMLGSDVTAYYGATIAGKTPSTTYDSPYNTLLHAGLPPTPISNISASSLQAVAHPASTDWLYFVSGDDGKTYFSHTIQEHEALTQKYCHTLCSQ